jgi:NTE family protein
MDAYGIFQGGGAKGYAHVGALKAAEERGIRFTRLAGTSAGAIIASLAAAGYTADELLDATRPEGERGILDVDVRTILDASEYFRVERIQRRWHALGNIPHPKGGLIGRWQRAKREFLPLKVLRGLKAACLEVGSIALVLRKFGLVGTEPVAQWLDGLLQAKVGVTRPVTFADLDMRLKIVAANLRTGLVHKFGFAGDEDLPIAPAAIASACFPFFFRPALQGGEVFVDGGLVSNLPVWLFDDERDDETSHLPTFGFRLVNDVLVAEQEETPTQFFPFVFRMGQTLASGARNLEERRIEYYHGIDLRAQIGTLSFAQVRARAADLVNVARDCVEQYFEREVGPQDPERMRQVLSLVVNELSDHFDWREERVRAHVLLPDLDGRHARTVYAWNMADDADDHLRVRTDMDGVGAAFRLREPVYLSPPEQRSAGVGALKYELAMRPSAVGGMYAIPIFPAADEWSKEDPSTRMAPFAALVIDKERDFAAVVLDEVEQDALANVAAIVGEEIRERSIVREPYAGRASARASGWAEGQSTPAFKVAARKVRDAGDGPLGARIAQALLRLSLIRSRSEGLFITPDAGTSDRNARSGGVPVFDLKDGNNWSED